MSGNTIYQGRYNPIAFVFAAFIVGLIVGSFVLPQKSLDTNEVVVKYNKEEDKLSYFYPQIREIRDISILNCVGFTGLAVFEDPSQMFSSSSVRRLVQSKDPAFSGIVISVAGDNLTLRPMDGLVERFHILRNTSAMLMAGGITDGTMGSSFLSFMLNKKNGIAVLARNTSISSFGDLPSGDLTYFTCE